MLRYGWDGDGLHVELLFIRNGRCRSVRRSGTCGHNELGTKMATWQSPLVRVIRKAVGESTGVYGESWFLSIWIAMCVRQGRAVDHDADA